MTHPDPESLARRRSIEASAGDDPTGWFEVLYSEAAEGRADVPWDRGAAHPLLVDWVVTRELAGAGRRAIVVGCGFGFDAELLDGQEFDTTAFDVSPTAVAAAKARHQSTGVRYAQADLFALPGDWVAAYDLVVEIMTVQALPPSLRGEAAAAAASLVAPGGQLLVIAVGREPDEVVAGPPWPLSRPDLGAFAVGGVEPVLVEDVREPAGTRRWRALFRR